MRNILHRWTVVLAHHAFIWKVVKWGSTRLPFLKSLLNKFRTLWKPSSPLRISRFAFLKISRGLEIDFLGPATRLHFFQLIFLEGKGTSMKIRTALVENTILYGNSPEIWRTVDLLSGSDFLAAELIRASQIRCSVSPESSTLKLAELFTERRPEKPLGPPTDLTTDGQEHEDIEAFTVAHAAVTNLSEFLRKSGSKATNFGEQDPLTERANPYRELVDHIASSKTPISFVRASDGEGALLQYDRDKNAFLKQVQHWWGDAGREIDFENFRNDLSESLRRATAIGIPTNSEVIANAAKTDRKQAHHFLGLSEWLKDNSEVGWKHIVPNGKSWLHYLVRPEFFRTLHDRFSNVIVVSPLSPEIVTGLAGPCRVISCGLHGRYQKLGLKPVDGATTNTEEIFEKIKGSTFGETVVIAAGGIGPKTLAAKLQRDGVSFLDLGATFNLAASIQHSQTMSECADFTVDYGLASALLRAQRLFFSKPESG